ncbi:MAG TPA: YqaE/Pmp3 family membrane protein [Mucilaginibacter sp.]|nr:YqaE/Pmp3 family membrane protein [Mucilaginibacter sp.]
MRYFLCILFPPAAVLTTGRIGAFILSCILTLFLWIPGVIHAVLVTNDFYESRRHRQLMREVKRSRYRY